MTKSSYKPCFLDKFDLLKIMRVPTNNTLILVDNNFVSMNKKAVKNTKIMTKDCEYPTSIKKIKFNSAKIKLNENSIVLINERYVSGILPITKYDADSISIKRITKKKLLPKE